MSAPTVYALLVGIDDYPTPMTRLRGCVNDAEAMRGLLADRLQDALAAVVLTDRQATRPAVVDEFRRHLGKAGPDDVALFFYAGHGAQEDAPPEWWGVEPDRRNETLVLHDSRRPGGHDLADKELAFLVAEVAAGGAHVLVVLDCCHSGSGTRTDEEAGARRAPPDDRPRSPDSYLGQDLPRRSRSAGPSGWAVLPRGRHVLLAACRSGQTAKEIVADGVHRGAATLALQRALAQTGDTLTYADLNNWLVADVRNRVADQTPQLEVADPSDLRLQFLGGAMSARPPHATLSHRDAEGWVVDQGHLHGVAAPSGDPTVFTVLEHGIDPADPTAQVAVARVLAVAPGHSRVDVAPRGLVVVPGRTYAAVLLRVPLPPVTVRVTGDPTATDAVRAALDGRDGRPPSALVAPVEDETARLSVDIGPGGVRIGRPGAVRPLVADLPADRVSELRGRLEHMARWLRLADLRNPRAGAAVRAVQVMVEPEGGGAADAGGLDLRYDGDTPPRFRFGVVNRGPATLYCALLDLTELYGVSSLVPGTEAVELRPGHELHALDGVQLAARIPRALHDAGVTVLTDALTVIVSTEPFDVQALLQDDLDE